MKDRENTLDPRIQQRIEQLKRKNPYFGTSNASPSALPKQKGLDYIPFERYVTKNIPLSNYDS